MTLTIIDLDLDNELKDPDFAAVFWKTRTEDMQATIDALEAGIARANEVIGVLERALEGVVKYNEEWSHEEDFGFNPDGPLMKAAKEALAKAREIRGE